MLSGAASFNCDLSRWNVSQGVKFVSFEMVTSSCFVSLSFALDLSSTIYYYILIIFIVCFIFKLMSLQSAMFNKAASFNSDLSGWDVSKGKSFVS